MLVVLVSLTHPDNIPSYPQFSPRKLLYARPSKRQPSCFLFAKHEPISARPLDIYCRSLSRPLAHLRGSDAAPRYSPRHRNSPIRPGIGFLFLFFWLLTPLPCYIQDVRLAVLALEARVWIVRSNWVDDMLITRLR